LHCVYSHRDLWRSITVTSANFRAFRPQCLLHGANVETLSIRDCNNVARHSLNLEETVAALQSCSRLTALKFSNSSFVNDELFMRMRPAIAAGFQSIRVSNCLSLTDKALVQMSDFHLEQLTHIHFAFCSFTDQGVLQLVRSCPRLAFVQVVDCFDVTALAQAQIQDIVHERAGKRRADERGEDVQEDTPAINFETELRALSSAGSSSNVRSISLDNLARELTPKTQYHFRDEYDAKAQDYDSDDDTVDSFLRESSEMAGQEFSNVHIHDKDYDDLDLDWI